MSDLSTRYHDLIEAEPGLRIRDAAARLDTTEAQLLACGCADEATRLTGPWSELMRRLPQLGEVMALTRNEAVVHERTGTYANVRIDPASGVGGVFAEEIDLRLFTRSWASGFATTRDTPRGQLRGLQIFDLHGMAVHKIYAREDTNLVEMDALIAAHRHPDPDAPLEIEPLPSPEPPTEPARPDAFLAGWSALQDTHDFRALLREHAIQRAQALRLAEGRFTRRVDAAATLERVLETAAADEVPIMVFAGNRGCLQIHGGRIERIVVRNGWINILDPRFNLHVKAALLRHAWVVRKPTTDGEVTSLEILGEHNALAMQVFGLRKPGSPEDPRWRAVLESALSTSPRPVSPPAEA